MTVDLRLQELAVLQEKEQLEKIRVDLGTFLHHNRTLQGAKEKAG